MLKATAGQAEAILRTYYLSRTLSKQKEVFYLFSILSLADRFRAVQEGFLEAALRVMEAKLRRLGRQRSKVKSLSQREGLRRTEFTNKSKHCSVGAVERVSEVADSSMHMLMEVRIHKSLRGEEKT